MKTIEEIRSDVRQLYEDILDLQKSMNSKEEGVDFTKIYATAIKNPIEGHKISELDEHTQRIYCKYLGNIINLTNDENTRYSQILFLSRIISSIKEPTFNTKDILLSSLNDLDLTEFVRCISEDIVDLFIVDSLILANISGNIENQVLEYISEIISLFKIDNNKFENLVILSKLILQQNDEGIKRHSKSDNLNLLLCYIKKSYDGFVVCNIKEAKESKAEKIFILYADIENQREVINIDDFYCTEINFINCSFENISGIYSENKKVKFYNCKFENCNPKRELIYINDGEIINCKFSNCEITDCGDDDRRPICLIYLNNGKIVNSELYNCNIKYNYNVNEKMNRKIWITMIKTTKIKNCKIKNCKVKNSRIGRMSFFVSVAEIKESLSMVYAIDGIIEDCKFNKCVCGNDANSKDDCKIIYLANSTEKNNELTDCIICDEKTIDKNDLIDVYPY